MTFLNRITEHGVVLKNRLPPGMKEFLVDSFFCYVPVSLLRVLWKELAGCYKFKTPRKGEVVVNRRLDRSFHAGRRAHGGADRPGLIHRAAEGDGRRRLRARKVVSVISV